MENRKHPERRISREYARAFDQVFRDDLAAGRKPRRPKLVYFVQTESGPIKIGIAIDPRDRMRLMQSVHHESLTLLGTAPGGRIRERQLHREFASTRIRGEWFQPSPDLLARIAILNGN